MLTATLLSLGAAVLHAGWNVAVKHSTGDRFVTLWGQFFIAGIVAAAVFGVSISLGATLPPGAYGWAAISGVVHVPYCWLLAKAYTVGDFSVVYPIARGGGALIAAFGGVLLLGDSFSALSTVGIIVVGLGLFALAGRSTAGQVVVACGVAATIGTYSVADAQGIRTADTPLYAAVSFMACSIAVTAFSLATGRGVAMRVAMRSSWRRFTIAGLASALTYVMVQLAFRRAPVGYVTCLRESSVVLAALLGWRMFDEADHRRRIAASVVVFFGLLILIAGS